ncbi:MAG: glycosyltransferase [Syntrophaceae bacterium]|nr:glycosyltransferase [Syntrophaceae bacterium]
MAPERCVLLMVKHPGFVPVKSRLAAALGPEAARSLYEALAADAVRSLASGDHALTVLYDPPEAREATASWLGQGPGYRPQRGADLGVRMVAGFREAFSGGFRKAVLVGSDVPGLGGDLVRQALTGLDGHDAVLGPARDGGYYLIGFRRETFPPEAFAGIPWSTGEVFSKTLEILEKNGRRVFVMPSRSDIDTAEDLERIAADPPAGLGPAFREWLLKRRRDHGRE